MRVRSGAALSYRCHRCPEFCDAILIIRFSRGIAMDARHADIQPRFHPPRRPWRPDRCDRIALVLQGGGALGAYQAGVYQALHEAGIEPDWVCGVSIGAINSAIIAGNPPEQRLERLQIFWDRITARKIWHYTPDGDIYRKARNAREYVHDDHAGPARLLQAARGQSLVQPRRRQDRDQLLRHRAAARNIARTGRLRSHQSSSKSVSRSAPSMCCRAISSISTTRTK